MGAVAFSDRHREILGRARHGIVTTIRQGDGLPSCNPVAIYWDGEGVSFSTLKSRMKFKSLQANPHIAMCIIDPENIARYVEIRGVAQLQDDPEGSLNKLIYRRVTGKEFDFDEPGAQRVVVRLQPLQISMPNLYGGRFERRAGESRG